MSTSNKITRFKAKGLPNITLGKLNDVYIQEETGLTFIKKISIEDDIFFDKNNIGKGCSLSSDYKKCYGSIKLTRKPMYGVKTSKIITLPLLVFCFQINTIGLQNPIIGFCNKNKDITDGNLNNTIYWDTSTTDIIYHKDTIKSQRILEHPLRLKNRDKIIIFIDRNRNNLVVRHNTTWGLNKIQINRVLFEDNGIKLSEYVPYIFPLGSEIELIKYPYSDLPNGYTEASCTPVLDWFKHENIG